MLRGHESAGHSHIPAEFSRPGSLAPSWRLPDASKRPAIDFHSKDLDLPGTLAAAPECPLSPRAQPVGNAGGPASCDTARRWPPQTTTWPPMESGILCVSGQSRPLFWFGSDSRDYGADALGGGCFAGRRFVLPGDWSTDASPRVASIVCCLQPSCQVLASPAHQSLRRRPACRMMEEPLTDEATHSTGGRGAAALHGAERDRGLRWNR